MISGKHLGRAIILLLFLSSLSPAWGANPGVGTVIGMEGRVMAARAGHPPRTLELLGVAIPGETVQTGTGAAVKFLFADFLVAILGEESDLVLYGIKQESGCLVLSLGLSRGKLWFATRGGNWKPLLEVSLPKYTIEVSQAAGVVAVGQKEEISILEGNKPVPLKIKLAHSVRSFFLKPGETMVLSEAGIQVIHFTDMAALLQPFRLIKSPPLRITHPRAPLNSPTTLEDKVRSPWPLFPPVDYPPLVFGPRNEGPTPLHK